MKLLTLFASAGIFAVLPSRCPALAGDPSPSGIEESIFIGTNPGWISYALQSELKANAAEDRIFGQSVAISGVHAAVLTQNGYDADSVGKLSLFDTDMSGQWTMTDYATVGNGLTFGAGPYRRCYSIASDGDDVVIGQPGATFIASAYEQGAAMFFRKNGEHWDFDGMIANPDSRDGQYFGCAVAISGSTAVIGAPNAGGGQRGAAFVAEFDGTTWNIRQKLTVSDVNSSCVGCAVAIRGNRLVLGAPSNRYAGETDSSHHAAYVFTRIDGSWKETAQLIAPDGNLMDDFAGSVAMNEDSIIVGAKEKNEGAGAIYAFTRTEDVWNLAQELIETAPPGIRSNFGFSLAVSGDRLLVGEPGKNMARLFQRTGTEWTSRASFVSDDDSVGEGLGWSVGLSGREAILSSPETDGGRAYVFRDDQIFEDGYQ